MNKRKDHRFSHIEIKKSYQVIEIHCQMFFFTITFHQIPKGNRFIKHQLKQSNHKLSQVNWSSIQRIRITTAYRCRHVKKCGHQSQSNVSCFSATENENPYEIFEMIAHELWYDPNTQPNKFPLDGVKKKLVPQVINGIKIADTNFVTRLFYSIHFEVLWI